MDVTYVLVAIAFLAVMATMGFCKYYKSPHRSGIYKRYSDGSMVTVAVVLSMIVAIVVVMKDGQNILRLFGENEYTTSILPHVGVIALASLVVAAYGALLAFMAKKISIWRKRQLRHHHRKREE